MGNKNGKAFRLQVVVFSLFLLIYGIFVIQCSGVPKSNFQDLIT